MEYRTRYKKYLRRLIGFCQCGTAYRAIKELVAKYQKPLSPPKSRVKFSNLVLHVFIAETVCYDVSALPYALYVFTLKLQTKL